MPKMAFAATESHCGSARDCYVASDVYIPVYRCYPHLTYPVTTFPTLLALLSHPNAVNHCIPPAFSALAACIPRLCPTSPLHTVLGLQGPCSDADEADAAALAESVVLWLSRRRCVSGVGQDVPRRGCDYAILAHHRPRRWTALAPPAASAKVRSLLWRRAHVVTRFGGIGGFGYYFCVT